MALNDYSKAKQAGDMEAALQHKSVIDENFPYFGYSYIQHKNDIVPPIGLTYYSFRIMVGLGMLFILLFLMAWLLSFKPEKFSKMRWFHMIAIVCMPLAWVASQSGWIVAEVGRQPWTIQDLLPVQAAVSKLEAGSVIITFFVFLVLFSALLVAELNIMRKAIKKGPETE